MRKIAQDEETAIAAAKAQAKKVAAQQKLEAERMHQNLDFQAKLQLGMRLSLQIEDELKELPQLLKPDMSIADLERLCMLGPKTINLKWFTKILPQITEGNYVLIDEILTFQEQLLDGPSNEEVVLLSETQVYEKKLIDTEYCDGAVTHEYEYIPVENKIHADSEFKITGLKMSIEHDGEEFVTSTYRVFTTGRNILRRLSSTELLLFGSRVMVDPLAKHVIFGSWDEWSSEVRRRFSFGFIRHLLVSHGLQKILIELLLEKLVFSNFPKFRRKLCFQAFLRAFTTNSMSLSG